MKRKSSLTQSKSKPKKRPGGQWVKGHGLVLYERGGVYLQPIAIVP